MKKVLRKQMKRAFAFLVMCCTFMTSFNLQGLTVQAETATGTTEVVTDQPVPEVITTSADGNVSVKETAKWMDVDRTKAEVNFAVNTTEEKIEIVGTPDPKDIIYVVDKSGSMDGERLAKVKEALQVAPDDLLNNPDNNRLAIVTFDDYAYLEQDFTTEAATFKNNAGMIQVGGLTSYTAALVKANDLINSRINEDNRPVIIFMSDGISYDNTDNIIQQLKDMNVEIYTIQYLLGNTIEPQLLNMATDPEHAYNAYNLNAITKVYEQLQKALSKNMKNVPYKEISLEMPGISDQFEITGITPNIGTAVQDGNKITVKVPKIDSGEEIAVKVELTLKDEVHFGNFTVHEKGKITYTKDEEMNAKTLELDSTVLSRSKYTVTFDGQGNDNGTVPEQIVSVVDRKVYIPGNTGNLSKKGQVFAGWIDQEGTNYYGGEITMPAKNLNLKAVWRQIDIEMNTEKLEAEPVRMKEGTKFQFLVGSATKIEFVNDTSAAPDTATDISAEDNESVLAWVEDTTLKVGSVTGGKIIAPQNASQMFGQCSPTEIKFNDVLDTSKVTDMSKMFYYCKATELDLSSFDTSNVTNMSGMFNGCSGLTALDASNFDTSNVTDMNQMFKFCRVLKTLNVSSFKTLNVTNMNEMFYSCEGLKTLDVSSFNTLKVTDMSYMFYYCKATKVNVSSFDTSNVTNMSNMFSGCNGLTELVVSNFNTLNVTNMSKMFSSCGTLTTLDVSKFNTSNVTDMSGMFNGCSGLTTLDLSDFDTSKVTSIEGMFSFCQEMTTLDISSFDISKIGNTSGMFKSSTKLTTGYAKDQDSAAILNGIIGSNIFTVKPSTASIDTFSNEQPQPVKALDSKSAKTSDALSSGQVTPKALTPDANGLVDGGKIKRGQKVDYSITLKNVAPAGGTNDLATISGMKVTNRLPEGMTYVDGTISVGIATDMDDPQAIKSGVIKNTKVENNVLTFTVFNLEGNAQIKLSYQATAPAAITGSYKEFWNNASVTAESVTEQSNDVLYYIQDDATPPTKHTLKYVYDGAAPAGAPDVPADTQYGAGQKVTPPTPSMPGYIFKGWEDKDGNLVTDTVEINADTTLTGSWEQMEAASNLTATVTYAYTGNVPENIYLPKEKSYVVGTTQGGTETITERAVAIEAAPTKDGYVFKGWTSDQLTTDQIADGSFLLGKEDVTLTGAWEKQTYTVTYKYLGTPPAGAGAVPDPAQYKWGDTVTTAQPMQNTATHNFDGWYSNNNIGADFKTQFTMPQEDVVLFGYWGEKPYNITYAYGTGEKPTDAPDVTAWTDMVSGNSDAMVRSNPVSAQKKNAKGKFGTWTFGGWSSAGIAIDDTGRFTMPESDVAMTGTWTFTESVNNRTITFKVENGTWADTTTADKVTYVELVNGEAKLEESAVPTGMIANTGFGNGHWEIGALPSAGVITDSVTFTYKFNPEHKVTYKYTGDTPEGDSKVPEANIAEGETTQVAAAPTTTVTTDKNGKTGKWVFDGWTSDDATIAADGTFAMPTKDVEVVGTWTFTKDHEVTFKVENGTWDGTDKADKTISLDTTEGKATLLTSNIPTGMEAAEGFGNGHWKAEPNVGTGGITGDTVYTFTFNPEHKVTYKYSGETPSDKPALPAEANIAEGETTQAAAPTTTATTDKNGKTGKWVFNGWTSDDVTIAADGTFKMPTTDVEMVGAWTFTKDHEVTFKVENGTWDGTDKADKTISLDTTEGKATLQTSDIPTGMKASEGFGNGQWKEEPNVTPGGITGDTTYTYEFKKLEAAAGTDKDQVKPNKDQTKPKTDDNSNVTAAKTGDTSSYMNYVLLCIVSLLVICSAIYFITKKKKTNE